MIANNLANQSSPGFKSDREFYSTYIAPEALLPEDQDVVRSPTAPVIERHWTDLGQGVLRATSEPFDFALDGPGFFRIRSPQGELLTRNGNFRLTRTGQLETQDGFAVLDQSGQPISLNPSQPIEVSAAGEIRQAGAAVASLAIVEGPGPAGLAKRAGTYFQLNPGAATGPATNTKIHHGRLENSNLAPAEGAVRLIQVMRQFESLTKALQIHGEMNRRADDVARASS
jgi:flagellar basal-body rod protein FlgF